MRMSSVMNVSLLNFLIYKKYVIKIDAVATGPHAYLSLVSLVLQAAIRFSMIMVENYF